jgi:ATP-binding cassette subfamily F protein 3
VLVEKLTARLTRGEVLGLVGPNGSGKSTLLKTLMGERAPESGTLRLGGSIAAAYYRQDLAQVPLGKTLYETIGELRPLWERRMVQGHLGRFGFSGDEVQRRAETLSGGERARVALAMMMLSRANLLVLDEPTNHLDVESIEALEDAIERYEGTVIIVSHDRALLRALATKVWVLHDRHVTEFDGSFAEWEVASEERAHAAAVRASEEEELRRVKERQKVQGGSMANQGGAASPKKDARRQQRHAEEAVAKAEQQVARLEARVAELTRALDEPDLYVTPEGVERARKLGVELDAEREQLDRALAEWAAATERMEQLGGAKV